MNGEALIRAVIDHHDDDTPRLVFADWLDDHAGEMPDPDDARDRAEFIRCHVELARLRLTSGIPEDAGDRLQARVNELLSSPRRWFDAGWWADTTWYGLDSQAMGLGIVSWLPNGEQGGSIEVIPERGFVGRLRCEARVWVAHADAILSLHPIRRVFFTTTHEFESYADGGRGIHRGMVGDRWVEVAASVRTARLDPNELCRLYLSARWPLIPPDGWEPSVLVTPDVIPAEPVPVAPPNMILIDESTGLPLGETRALLQGVADGLFTGECFTDPPVTPTRRRAGRARRGGHESGRNPPRAGRPGGAP